MDADNGRVENATFKQYGETIVSASSGAAYTVNLSTGNTFKLTLTANCAITFANPLSAGTANIFTIVLVQDGGTRSVTWPAAVKWASGTAPTLATAAGAIDSVTFMTVDGGTRYFGFAAGGTTTAPAAPSGARLFAWGRGVDGRLGLGDAISRSSPTQIGTLGLWSSVGVSGNGQFGFATRTNGTLWAWGKGSRGYLGTNDTVYRSSPIQVGALTGWSNMSSSYSSTFAIKADGTMWTWGFESLGQLGVGVSGLHYVSSPIQIGTLATWSTTATGRQHTLALKTDGTLWTWGRGNHGENGDLTAIYRSSPVQVGTLATWSGVSAGGYTSFAVRTNGTLWSWGYNAAGFLGLGDVANRSSPTQVGTLTTWASVGSAYVHTFAIKTDGTMWAWGRNSEGALGLGDQGAVNATARSSPVQVGTLATWSRATGGSLSSRALKTDGTMWAWGTNGFGELGLADIISRSSPVQVTSSTGWVSIGGGVTHGFALQDPALFTGKVPWVWGLNSSGQLGMSDTVNKSSPVQLSSSANWSSIAGGNAFRLALKNDGTIWSWGKNHYGQLGLGDQGAADATARSSPTQIGTLATWTKIIAANKGVAGFAIQSPGTLWSWGYGAFGSLGHGGTTSRSSPTQVGTLANWANIGTGQYSTFAVKTDGSLWVVGSTGGFGVAGRGTAASNNSPIQIGTLTDWSSVSGNYFSILAVKTTGTLWSWGWAQYGRLGLGDTIDRSSPTQVGTLATWAEVVSTGTRTVTARKTDGTIWTMGKNTSLQLGLGDNVDRSSPTQIGTLTTWSALSAGSTYTTLGLQSNGTLWAWGTNPSGALGLGDTTNRSVPVQIGTLTDWVSPGPMLSSSGGHFFRLG